jgi:putative oxidoreductase
MAVPTALQGTPGIALLIGRLLFGGVLAFMGLNHFMQTDQLAGYAESKGLPAPRIGVLVSGALLVVGGLAVASGAYAAVGAALIAVFLVVATPTIHDFWTFEDPEAKQQEMVNFLKNVGLLGAAIALGAIALLDWPYAVAAGL